MTASRQSTTGRITEQRVKEALEAHGLSAVKPVPDRGVDLLVTPKGKERPTLKVQIKGRGAQQTNRRYRWFQVRLTKAQRESAVAKGLRPDQAWEEKVRKCDFFILVALKHKECWVLPQDVALEIGRINRAVYGNRSDNRDGRQAELDLDIEHNGQPLTEIYSAYLNAFHLLKDELESRMT